jgi:HEAT repeat protein
VSEVRGSTSGRRWLRFSLSHLFLLTLVVGLILGWWFDRRRLAARNELFQLQVERLQASLDEARHSVGVVSAEKFSRFATGGDFLEVLDPQVDWYEFQDELMLFAKSPAASSTVPLLIQRLSDPSPDVRTRALAALGVFKQRPAEVVPALTARLNDPVSNAGWHAACALGEFGAEAKSAASALDAIFHDDRSSIATHCGLMLVKIDPSVDIGPRLIELTQSPIRENRWRAVHALVDHVKPDVAQTVLTKLFETEQDQEIRIMIADALNRQHK